MQRRHLLGALGASAASWALPGAAQTAFPSRSLTIVVPASPGGAIDLAARLIGQKLSEAWNQPVVVDNRAGATGIIGTDFVAKSPPDGHTLALVASSHAINPSMVRKLPFDTLRSFEPVVLTHVVPLVLVVAPSLPVRSVQELIAYAKARPGQLAFASSGSGGAPHFSGELFKSMAGLDLTHIPYKGSTLAHPDLMSGRVALMFDTLAAVNAQVKAGKLRALAVTSAQRSPAMPDVPTLAELGVPNAESGSWTAVMAPAGTPPAIVERLSTAVQEVARMPEVKEALVAQGATPRGSTAAELQQVIDADKARYGQVIKTRGVRID